MCVLVSALINIILNAILVPKFGAVAACYTTVVSYVLLFFLAKYVGDHEIKGLYCDKWLYFFMGFSIVLCIVFESIVSSLIFRILIYGFILIVIFVYVCFKVKEIKGFIWKGR